MVRKLVQGELAENVAKAAVQEVKNLDVDECYLWALENEFDEENIQRLVRDFDKEMGKSCTTFVQPQTVFLIHIVSLEGFTSDGNAIGVIKDVINDRMNLGLSQIIEMIQQNIVDETENNIGTIVNTVCERYFSRTAVSFTGFNLLCQSFC